MLQSSAFLTLCYGSPAASITECRQKVWATRIAKSASSTPELSKLPPTNEAALHNIKRVHYQDLVWMVAMEADPNFSPSEYGWEKGLTTEIVPLTIDPGVSLVSEKLIECGCKSEAPFEITPNCTYRSANIVHTVFCGCSDGVSCCNKRNITADVDEN